MKKPSMQNFSLQEIYNNKKWKYYDFARAINCTRKLTCVCPCACACDHTRLREQCVLARNTSFLSPTFLWLMCSIKNIFYQSVKILQWKNQCLHSGKQVANQCPYYLDLLHRRHKLCSSNILMFSFRTIESLLF